MKYITLTTHLSDGSFWVVQSILCLRLQLRPAGPRLQCCLIAHVSLCPIHAQHCDHSCTSAQDIICFFLFLGRPVATVLYTKKPNMWQLMGRSSVLTS
jgi:hypothetical protein